MTTLFIILVFAVGFYVGAGIASALTVSGSISRREERGE